MKELGFIVLRHVNNELTNKYWIECIDSIRRYYPENKIIIIDDDSDYRCITDKRLYNTTIIRSQYPKRGELLPYYYYLRNKLFDVAVILHDSVFLNKPIDTNVTNYKFLWDFDNICENVEDQTKMINAFNDYELTEFFENKNLWRGCFGCMSIIEHDYLTHVNSKYDLSKLLPHVLNRTNRCSFERVIACILQKESKMETLFGNIHKYCRWGIPFVMREQYTQLPITKCWTGR